MTNFIKASTQVLDVYHGDRDLTIIESAKLGDRTYELAVDMATNLNMPHRCIMTVGEDGETLGEAVFVAQKESTLKHAVETVLLGSNHTKNYYPLPRNYIAKELGQLLGYSSDAIAEFVDGEVHRSCKCSLCGGAYVYRKIKMATVTRSFEREGQIRRTMYHA